MIINREYFDVLSRGKDRPEHMPSKGERVVLRLCRKESGVRGVGAREHLVDAFDGNIDVEYVEPRGPYAHVMGTLYAEPLDQEQLPVRGSYLFNQKSSLGAIIGEILVLTHENENQTS